MEEYWENKGCTVLIVFNPKQVIINSFKHCTLTITMESSEDHKWRHRILFDLRLLTDWHIPVHIWKKNPNIKSDHDLGRIKSAPPSNKHPLRRRALGQDPISQSFHFPHWLSASTLSHLFFFHGCFYNGQSYESCGALNCYTSHAGHWKYFINGRKQGKFIF